jgi:hypothetical protein
LSPKLPHIGIIKKETRNGAEKTYPLHREVSARLVTPNSLINKGRNGTTALNPVAEKKRAIQRINRFFFQVSMYFE